MSSMARTADVMQGNDTQPPDPVRSRAVERLRRVRRSAYLAERRAAVAEATAAGLTWAEAARLLGMSEKTVQNDMRAIRSTSAEAGASTDAGSE